MWTNVLKILTPQVQSCTLQPETQTFPLYVIAHEKTRLKMQFCTMAQCPYKGEIFVLFHA